MFDILIIGAGITGSMLARDLSRYKLKVAVIDKENDVGNVTSSANSAIIHSGYDPIPGSLKAKLNVLGNPMFDQICDELDVKIQRIGSLTVALEDEQLPLLKELESRSKENGVNVRLIDSIELKKIEPNISNEAKGALLAESAGIIDPFNLVIHLMENAVDNGVQLFLDEEVISISNKNDVFFVKTNKHEYQSKIVINAAGCNADKIAKMVDEIDWKMIPRKGEYFVFDHFLPKLVNHVIFPLPSIKGKGILVAPTTSGNFLMGPSSEEILDANDVSTDLPTLSNIKEQACALVPIAKQKFNQMIRVFAGVRPTTTRHDFIIESSNKYKNFINVAGIESPGLVSSPAISNYVIDNLISKLIDLEINPSFNPFIKKYHHLSSMNEKDRNDLIKKDPDFGTIICSCEKVSLGEIKETLSRSVPPRTVKGVKRRVRAGFGLCQGGFCSPSVTLILAKHYNVSPLEIKWDKDGSEILLNKVKEIE
ncbi:MAG: FAD-dependent oxidoreductase [Bacilli bacterium]|nr:FAD-dependent oxidoreductase [Bacilli bacterium]